MILTKRRLWAAVLATAAAQLAIAESCIVSGSTVRSAAGGQASGAVAVSANGTTTAGRAVSSSFDSRCATEATGMCSRLDTRAPKGILVMLK